MVKLAEAAFEFVSPLQYYWFLPSHFAVTHQLEWSHSEVSLSAEWTVAGCQWACPVPLGLGRLPETTLLSQKNTCIYDTGHHCVRML